MEFWSSRGTVGSPVLPSCEQSLFRAYHSVSLISRFSHSFLLSTLILLKVPGWPPSLGYAEVCPSRHHRFGSSTFPFSFPSGRNHVLPTWKPLVIILFFMFLCSGSPRFFFCLCHERSLGFTGACVLLLCFLFFSSVFFFQAVLVFLWLCAWKDPRLLMVAEDPDFLSLIVVFFFLLDASSSGLQVSWAFLFLRGSPASTTLDLAWSFPLLGLTHSFGPPLLWSFLDLNTVYRKNNNNKHHRIGNLKTRK